jgi:hypothetical protein
MDDGLGTETLPSQDAIMHVHPSFSTYIHPSNLLSTYLYNQLTYTHDNTTLRHVSLRKFWDFQPISIPLIVPSNHMRPKHPARTAAENLCTRRMHTLTAQTVRGMKSCGGKAVPLHAIKTHSTVKVTSCITLCW